MKGYLKSFIIIVISFSLIFTVACSSSKKRIKIAGSTTVLPIVQAAAEVYMEKNPDVNISVRGGGSSIGIKSIVNSIIDIGNSSREAKAKEKNLLATNDNLVETAIALDALSLINNISNCVDSLSTEDLKKVYTGKISNWAELGGDDLEIIAISRDVSSGSYEVFNDIILEGDVPVSSAMMLASNNAVATTVGNTPGAIGYVGYGYTSYNAIKTLALEGVKPTESSVYNNSYKLIRFLYMYTLKSKDNSTQDFIDFIGSEEGQDIVENQGYLRINEIGEIDE